MVILAIYASIVLAKVAGQHYLIQQEMPLVFIGSNKHQSLIHTEHLAHHIHRSSGKAQHLEPLQSLHHTFTYICIYRLLQQIVIVHHLAQTYTLTK